MWLKLRKSAILFIALIPVICIHCNKDNTTQIAFYYWRTNYVLNQTEQQIIRDNNVNTLYIRYFDVDLSNPDSLAVPVAIINFTQKPDVKKIIPVIFIKNKVFTKGKTNTQQLAAQLNTLVNAINKQQALAITEIQVDCDWSDSSRDSFMQFINYFKIIGAKTISATIRLHQVKYHKITLIPNVDYGVLMYYNMGDVNNLSENSIYNKKTADKYISALSNYPLKLKIALPIYSWAVQIRKGQIINLVNKIDFKVLNSSPHFIKTSDNLYVVKNSCFFSGFYFVKDDQLKIELINFSDIKQMASDINNNLKYKPEEVIFFDLDSANFNNLNHETNFKKISDCFYHHHYFQWHYLGLLVR